MKVAVYYNNRDIRLEEMPKPKISEGEILVKVKASGICGTDVMEWYRIKKAPRVLGHEASGEIVESKSDKYAVGQRVFVSHHVPCNKCKYCLKENHTACKSMHNGNYEPGGFSEYIRVPKINVENGTQILPENISYEEATVIEPLACVIRAQRLLNIKKDETTIIMGCGMSGLLNIRLAKLRGAKVIATDINEYRLKIAKESGADIVVNAGNELNAVADHIIICTGAMPAFESAFKYIDKKGKIMLFAIPKENINLPNSAFWRNEMTITSSYGAAPVDLEESLELISSGKITVKDLITDKLKLDEIQKGFDIASAAKESLKVVIIPHM